MGSLVNVAFEQRLHAPQLLGLRGLGINHLNLVLFLHDANLVPQDPQFLLLVSVLLH